MAEHDTRFVKLLSDCLVRFETWSETSDMMASTGVEMGSPAHCYPRTFYMLLALGAPLGIY